MVTKLSIRDLCDKYIRVRKYWIHHTPFNLIFGVEATGILDLCFPDKPDNVPKNLEHAYQYWIGNLTLLRKLARENNVRAKEIQKLRYDRHTKPHKLKVGDKVLIKVHGIREHEDINYDNSSRGYIQLFLSFTNKCYLV